MARKKPQIHWKKLPNVDTPIGVGMVSNLARGLIAELNQQIAAIRVQRSRGRRDDKWVPLLELLQEMEERVEGALDELTAGIEEHELEEVPQ